MNPEQIAALLREIDRAFEEGLSEDEINDTLRELTDRQVRSVGHLLNEAKRQGLTTAQIFDAPPPAEEERGGLQKIKEALTPAIQGATGGFASDIIGGLEKVGVAAPGASERFRGELEQAREDRPIVSGATQLAALLGGPVGKAGALGFKGVRAAAGAGARGAAKVAPKFVPPAVARIGGGAAAGAAAGGVEGAATGGLLGFGEAAGEPVSERLKAASGQAAVGGLLGAAVGGASQAVGQTRQALQQARSRGERLATSLEEGAELGGARVQAQRVEQGQEATRRAFRVAEGQGQAIPAEITELTRTNPTIRAALQRSRSQESKRALESFRAFEAKEAGSVEPLSFQLADEIRKDLQFTAKSFARRAPDASGRVPSATKAREAKEAFAELTEQMNRIRGFEEGVESAFQVGSMRRAFKSGRTLARKTADEVEDAFGALKTADAKDAFREGIAVDMIEKLRSGQQSVKSFVQKAQTGSSVQRKLRVLFPDEQAFQGFMAAVEREGAAATTEEVIKDLIKWGAFLAAGSSLFGRGVVEVLE